MKTWHIHIEGQVQGVGFRPFVFVLAKKHKLNGWVNNTTDGVHIEFNASKSDAISFCKAILNQAPILARITRHYLDEIEEKFFDSFEIVHSTAKGKANLLLTPDVAMCGECQFELHDVKNRRQQYAFITCTNCGPRYSIIQNLPYDRIHTTMQQFEMCTVCREEYDNPLDRRYYSQTTSCLDCSIELVLYDKNQNVFQTDLQSILTSIVEHWQDGKIVAIKGIGGYLLTCDAANEEVIKKLRIKKHRPSKPFAVMFPNFATLEEMTELSEKERKALNYPLMPIVLLDIKQQSALAFEDIAPKLSQLGVMLPYTPLYDLLLKKFGKPIIATSGNISGSPIVFQDEKAFLQLGQIADLILVNNREIVVPQDDSLFKFSFFKQQKIILRRSRGLAPTYINANLKLPQKSLLAMGAMLKSAFTFLHQGNTYVSQYLGDLEQFDTQQNYQHTIQHFLSLFNTQPERILVDKHPEYPSTQYGKQLAQNLPLPFNEVQHHIAHFGAVLGENNLIDSQKPILGVIWDGTGLGEDGQIWGGEFFKYQNHDFLRCYYFDYFDFILGDKMPKEPRISALSTCWEVMRAMDFLESKFSKTEWNIYCKLLAKENPLQTSSVGRIFDAVASLLGIMDKQSYEGEAAMQLEALATSYFKKHGLEFSESYFREGAHYYRIPTKTLMTHLIMDLKKGKAKDFIAAKFHFSLMKIIKIVANNLKISKICFSGGVFQNSLLVDLIIHYLKEDFELFFHKQLSPNDECVSFGQLVVYHIECNK